MKIEWLIGCVSKANASISSWLTHLQLQVSKMDLDKLESRLANNPFLRRAVKSIKTELGNSLNKHATMQNLCRHVAKHQRQEVKEVVWVLYQVGALTKHRTDTFCWPPQGLEWANSLRVDA